MGTSRGTLNDHKVKFRDRVHHILQRFSNQESRTDLKATHRLPIVKRASGDRAPVAALLVRSISSSDLPRLITTRMAVRSLLAEDVALAGLPAGTLPCLPIAVSALRDTCKQPLNFEVSNKEDFNLLLIRTITMWYQWCLAMSERCLANTHVPFWSTVHSLP